MFDLIYRDNAGGNTGHYEGIDTNGSESYKRGQVVSLVSGKASACGGANNTNKPYGIVVCDTDASEPVVVCMKIDSNMEFKCPVTGTDEQIASLYKGKKIAIDAETADCQYLAVAAVTANVGAVVVDTCGAQTAGDYIIVSFE